MAVTRLLYIDLKNISKIFETNRNLYQKLNVSSVGIGTTLTGATPQS
jgi:hypothetical protein